MVSFPFEIIDLTHTLSPHIPCWDGDCGFDSHIVLDYDHSNQDVTFRVQHLQMQAGIGTHMDAPSHCIAEGRSIADLALGDLIAPCVMIDVSAKVNERYCVIPEDIIHFEQRYGRIQNNSLVIIYTGWEQFWEEPEKYRNHYVFPSVAAATAELLLERHIVGLGIDTLSADRPDSGYPVHQLILGSGKYLIENVAHAAQLPAVGSYSLALPIKIHQGTEAPMRFIGLIKNKDYCNNHADTCWQIDW